MTARIAVYILGAIVSLGLVLGIVKFLWLISNPGRNHMRMFKMGWLVLALIVVSASSTACNVTPGDGQVGKAVMEGYSEIRDTASEVKDAVDATGDSIEVETHESPLTGLWELAEEIHSQDTIEESE